MKCLRIFILLLLTGLLIFNTSSAQSIFIKIGDIKGESLDSKHRDWFEVLSFSDGLGRNASAATGAGRARSSVSFNDIVFTRMLDKSTPKLIEAIAKGIVTPTVNIEFASSNRTVYYRITLSNVIISSYSVNASESAKPLEQLSLNYEKITWEYIEPNGSKVTTSYNVDKRM